MRRAGMVQVQSRIGVQRCRGLISRGCAPPSVRLHARFCRPGEHTEVEQPRIRPGFLSPAAHVQPEFAGFAVSTGTNIVTVSLF
jgi:hypothetical protein